MNAEDYRAERTNAPIISGLQRDNAELDHTTVELRGRIAELESQRDTWRAVS